MAGAASRRKGAKGERDVVHALRRAGWTAITSRASRGGTQGGEDIISNFPLVLEVKDQKEMRLASWVEQAREQAGEDVGAVVHKRVGKALAEDWYVTMTFGDLLRWVSPREGDDGTDETDGG